ncbi:MAG: hypothetical protein WCK90_01545 [archaeon]
MENKFKRHQEVRLLVNPDTEYIEYHSEEDVPEEIPIVKGMKARINIVLPNGKYHLEILNDAGDIIAYVPVDEEEIEAV